MNKIHILLVFMDPETKGRCTVHYSTLNVDADIQSVNICRLHDGKFISLLKCNCNTEINTHGVFTVIHRHVQRGERFELPNAHMPRLNKDMLCLLVSALLL